MIVAVGSGLAGENVSALTSSKPGAPTAITLVASRVSSKLCPVDRKRPYPLVPAATAVTLRSVLVVEPPPLAPAKTAAFAEAPVTTQTVSLMIAEKPGEQATTGALAITCSTIPGSTFTAGAGKVDVRTTSTRRSVEGPALSTFKETVVAPPLDVINGRAIPGAPRMVTWFTVE